MFDNILVPVDLSDKSLSAVRKAVEIANIDKAAITLLHVIETIQGIEFEELEEFYQELDAKATKVMAQWCTEAEADNLRLESLVIYGRRAAEVLRVAAERDCDLIIVTSHRVDAEHPGGGLGTISHQIALLADCSVMLIR
jgi:universal stress protein A